MAIRIQGRGRRRRAMESAGGPSKTLGKTKVSHMVAAGKTVVCSGPIWATSNILRLSENLQRPLVKQGFEHENQVARKKQACGRQRLTMESAGAPSKTIGKTRF